MANFVTIERGLGPGGRVAVVRFDRGDRINALSDDATRELTRAAQCFEDDAETSVVILTGGKSFSAGADMKAGGARSSTSTDVAALRRQFRKGPRLTRAWYEMDQVTIAAIEGFCIGSGLALAVALDFRIMARDAHIRIPEIALGMNMSWQTIPRMLQLIGPARTKQAVILANQSISAEEAYQWGLVEQLTEPGETFNAAMELAEKVAAQPSIPVAMTKQTINRLAGALDDLASHMDLDQLTLTCLTEDHKEGVAAFRDKRKPQFKGR
ncbi:enoyl-CoA hydratase/isomerase family protein [Bradyrhizobium lupini]|uniref:enoyl-CoA hydratase/isomerase family protein n=1 Tax=Rhizobium lupini TaxID=136996 RepID=UPI00366F1CBF